MESTEDGDILITKFIGNIENDYRKTGKFCDFTLKLINTGDLIEVHKVILASRCPYFQSLFNSEMIECNNGYLELKDFISYTELENIITYLYTGYIKISFLNATIYYQHALYFQLEKLENFCKIILIKNINTDTCLNLWRFGVTFCNELKLAAFNYILENAIELFNNVLFLDLTEKEIIDLISNDKLFCAEDEICSFIIKWLNFDFNNRHFTLNNLIEEIRFLNVNEKFLTTAFLNNDILLQNKKFLIIVKEILKSKIDFVEMSCLKFNKLNLPRIGFRKKTVVALCDKILYECKEKQSKILVTTHCSETRITPFFNNYLLLAEANHCEFYCPATNIIKKFPDMKIKRVGYNVIELNNKIYCCGGTDNIINSVEEFDLNTGIWMDGTNMIYDRVNFGITTWENCIYVFGGQKTNENIIERYDPRKGQWTSLSAIKDVSRQFVRGFSYNEKFYIFTLSEGFIFDYKANKWMDEGINHWKCWSKFDLTESDGIVYVTSIYENREYMYEKYNIDTKTWFGNTGINSFTHTSMATIMI